eukprot:COSAG02_NODE_2580_length_8493_cov_3.138432_8_plen_96_part_00
MRQNPISPPLLLIQVCSRRAPASGHGTATRSKRRGQTEAREARGARARGENEGGREGEGVLCTALLRVPGVAVERDGGGGAQCAARQRTHGERQG